MTRAGYQGVPGAFSEDAARAVLARIGEDLDAVVAHAAFEDVFDAVRDHRIDLGVVPVENTLAGSVQATYDLLRERGLTIIDEHVHRIEHCLIAPPGVPLDTLQRVLSHPVALAQCRRFLASHPGLTAVATADTAGAVELIMSGPPGVDAAIASRRSAELYGAAVLLEHLEDDPANYTRFLVIARQGTPVRPLPHDAPRKTSLVLTLAHRPGALVRALEQFARRGVDLTMIESRPRRGRPFEYTFSIDLAGGIDDPNLATAIAAVDETVQELHVLGSYPRAGSPLERRTEPAA